MVTGAGIPGSRRTHKRVGAAGALHIALRRAVRRSGGFVRLAHKSATITMQYGGDEVRQIEVQLGPR